MKTSPSTFIALFVIALASASAFAADSGGQKSKFQVIPSITVEQLKTELQQGGFDWKALGRQITFTGTVINGGATPLIRIEGMDKDSLDTATIHNARPDITLKPGEKIQVTGLIVDQWYAVWQIWRYEMSRIR